MNSDFRFKGFSWEKVIVFVLCLTMLVPSSSVFAADKSNVNKVEVSVSTKAGGSITYYPSATDYTEEYVYTGRAIKPDIDVWVTYNSNKGVVYNKLSSSDYTMTCGTFNSKASFKKKTAKDVGIYYAKITFKGKYKKCTAQYVQFKIVPKTVTLKKVKAASNGRKATVTWNSLPKATVEKYDVSSSVYKNFTNDQKVYSYYYGYGFQQVKNSATSATIKNQASYPAKNYVRVRAYKTVTFYDQWGSKYQEKLYGDWSKAKSVSLKNPN